MAYLMPADKLTHYLAGSLIALPLLLIGGDVAALGVLVAAVGREVYGRLNRGRQMNPADWREAALDIGATLAGGSVVLLAAYLGK